MTDEIERIRARVAKYDALDPREGGAEGVAGVRDLFLRAVSFFRRR